MFKDYKSTTDEINAKTQSREDAEKLKTDYKISAPLRLCVFAFIPAGNICN